jgi:hypothetical protein
VRPAAQLPPSTAIYDACRADLIGLGRLDTSRGQLLLVLADGMDREISARGLVALVDEFRRQLAEIGQARPSPSDPVEELRPRHRLRGDVS